VNYFVKGLQPGIRSVVSNTVSRSDEEDFLAVRRIAQAQGDTYRATRKEPIQPKPRLAPTREGAKKKSMYLGSDIRPPMTDTSSDSASAVGYQPWGLPQHPTLLLSGTTIPVPSSPSSMTSARTGESIDITGGSTRQGADHCLSSVVSSAAAGCSTTGVSQHLGPGDSGPLALLRMSAARAYSVHMPVLAICHPDVLRVRQPPVPAGNRSCSGRRNAKSVKDPRARPWPSLELVHQRHPPFFDAPTQKRRERKRLPSTLVLNQRPRQSYLISGLTLQLTLRRHPQTRRPSRETSSGE